MEDYSEEDWAPIPTDGFGAPPPLPPAPGDPMPMQHEARVRHSQSPVHTGQQQPSRPMQQAQPMQSVGSDFADTGYAPPVHQMQVAPQQEMAGDEAISNGHMLGLSVIAAGIGGAAGGYFGGKWGLLAGSLFGGAAVNAFRALKYVQEGTEEDDKEAVISGTYALVTTGLGIYVWVKMAQPKEEVVEVSSSKRMRANVQDVEDGGSIVPCSIRRVD